MRTHHHRIHWRRLALLAAGTTFFLSGCDPQLRSTVESGIISVSQSLLGSILQAFIQLAAESGDQTAGVLADLGPILG